MHDFLRPLRPLCTASAALLISLAAGCGGGSNSEDGTRTAAARTPTQTVYASGLTNPRGLAFGPDGGLYVAEAGTGGDQTATGTADCPAQFNIYSPYRGGASGRVLRVGPEGATQVVAAGLPSTTDATGASFGPTDVAFVGGTLYVLIEMGGCAHGLPDTTAGIRRVNPDGTTTLVADLSAWLEANPPAFIKDTDPATTDFEPGGVFHSMIAVDGQLHVVETNRGLLVSVDPATGTVTRLYDMSVDGQEHNPIVMARRGNTSYVGTFGEDGGPAELAVFDRKFGGYTQPFKALNPIVGLAWRGPWLYAVEIFPLDDPWSPASANLVAFDPRSGERQVVLPRFASFPNGLVRGPDGALYTSNWGLSFAGGGDGQILRITPGAAAL